jgi:hypothetical protein
MLPRFCGGNGVLRMVLGKTANGNRVQIAVVQHVLEVCMTSDFRAMPQTHLGGVQRARGIDFGDPALGRRVDRGDVRPARPAIPDNSNLIFFHECCAAYSPPWRIASKLNAAWWGARNRPRAAPRRLAIEDVDPRNSPSCILYNQYSHTGELREQLVLPVQTVRGTHAPLGQFARVGDFDIVFS